MTGQLTVIPSGESVVPHTHGFFVLDDGRELRYTDIRRFGRMLLVPESRLADFTGTLGKEPLEISAEEFCRNFGSRRARVKALLLDQRVLRGIGNIYADESLFRARLHPARIAENLTKKQLLALHGASPPGSGRGHSFPRLFDFRLRRFRRQSRRIPAPAPRLPARRETVLSLQGKNQWLIVAGRSSHFCPRCQPAPRNRRGSKKSLKPQMNTDKHR